MTQLIACRQLSDKQLITNALSRFVTKFIIVAAFGRCAV